MSKVNIDLKSIVKILYEQSINITNLTGVVILQSVLLYNALEKCVNCKTIPFTVTHSHTKQKMCDRCASEFIVSAKRSSKSTSNNQTALNFLKLISDVNTWEDDIDSETKRKFIYASSALKQKVFH